jgi:hypothetical protein
VGRAGEEEGWRKGKAEGWGRGRVVSETAHVGEHAIMTLLEMAMGTRNPMGFYPIRVRFWVNFHTHGFVNGHKCIPDGFMGTSLFL